MKPVGAAGDGSDLSVEALDATVAEAGGDEGEDAFEVAADGPRDPLERPQAGAHGPTAPFQQLRASNVQLPPLEDRGQSLLEHVGAKERSVGALDVGELVMFAVGEIPRVLEQRPPGLLEPLGVAVSSKQADLLASHLVDGLLRELLHRGSGRR